MQKPEYAFGIFNRHFERSNFGSKNGNYTVLELRPEDSLLTAMLVMAILLMKVTFLPMILPFITK